MKRMFAMLIALTMMLTCVTADADTLKKERVFAVVNASGEAGTIIDNIQLSNPDGTDTIVDRTSLTDIENVGGHETFALDGTTLTWTALGQAIHYQGNGSAPLAVTPVVTFTANGREIPADEVSQFSGELTITVSYTVQEPVPFLALSAMIVPTGMTSITLDHAILLDEGSRQLIVGYAVPGADPDLALPASFTVRCDADHAEIGGMMTVATADPISALCDRSSGKVSEAETTVTGLVSMLTALKDGTEMPELDDDMAGIANGIANLLTGADALASGTEQVSTGTASLATGAVTLQEGAAALSAGAASLDSGAAALEAGLTTLTENNEALNAGALQLFNAILATANQQLKASGLDASGIVIPELTAENYAKILDGAVQQLNGMIEQGKANAEAQIRTAVTAQEATIREGVTQAIRGKVLTEVLTAAGLTMTAEEYTAAAKSGKLTAAQTNQIDAAVNAQMESTEIKAAVDAAVSSKIDELVAENAASEAVQNQLKEAIAPAEAAITSLSALKAQLDQVSTFVTGVQTYTDGVAQAQSGCVSLHAGATELATGAASLSAGADTLSAGAAELSAGAVSLSEGAGQLKDGLHTAVAKAADRALPCLTGDIQKYIDAFNRTKDSVEGMHGYDLAADDTAVETVYLIRTEMK